MTQINSVGNGLSGSTGTGSFVGASSPTITTPIISQINDTNGNAELKFTTSASAVNYFTIKNNSTGNTPSISATGTDPNISFQVQSKGTGSFYIYDGNTNLNTAFSSVASAVNYWQFYNNATLNPVTVYAQGSDTNVGMTFITKGTGAFVLESGALTQPLTIYNGTSNQHTTTFAMSNTAASRTVTFPDYDGTTCLMNAATATNGFIPIGNGTNFTPAAITAGTGITVTNGAGSISIATSGSGTGSIAQIVQNTSTSSANTTTTMNVTSVPTNTQGAQYLSVAITPGSSSNHLMIDVYIPTTSVSSNIGVVYALFQSGNSNAICAGVNQCTGNGTPFSMKYYMQAGTTSSTTFSLRFGPTGSSTVYINSSNGASANNFGVASVASLTVTEIVV